MTMIPIASIKTGKRHRQDHGDIAALAASIRDIGLMHPVVIKPDRTLIAGERRLMAFKQLGRDVIPVTQRKFRLTEPDLAWLLEAAQRLEASG
jgi:ParB-like chromosome segregation protein Spo0J